MNFVKLRFWKKDKPLSFADQEMQSKLRIETGFSEIDVQQDTRRRLEIIQMPFLEMINELKDEINLLLKKKPRSAQDEEQLSELRTKIFNLLLHKSNKMVATAWSIAAEDRDMSERYSALESFFARVWNDPSYATLLFDAEMYMLDISFREKHVGPAPHILIQSLPTAGRIGFATKEEEI